MIILQHFVLAFAGIKKDDSCTTKRRNSMKRCRHKSVLRTVHGWLGAHNVLNERDLLSECLKRNTASKFPQINSHCRTYFSRGLQKIVKTELAAFLDKINTISMTDNSVSQQQFDKSLINVLCCFIQRPQVQTESWVSVWPHQTEWCLYAFWSPTKG